MKKALLPSNEIQRLKALHDLNILDTGTDEAFDKITRLLQVFYKVPIAALSLVDSHRQWFKSIQGLDAHETSRDVAFCAHTINQDNTFIINDTLQDDRFCDNPLVTDKPNIRFYAGYPIRARTGEKIGSLCIIDTQPRVMTIKEISRLKEMAAAIETELYAHTLAKGDNKISK